MASIASLIGIPDRFAYSMTKGAVLTMTRSIAVDYVKRGIRCNCICPARVHTPFVDGYLAENYPGREAEMMKTLSEYQPIGRMGQPDEIAQPRALSLLRRSVVRHRPGLSHRRRGDRGMKLARFGDTRRRTARRDRWTTGRGSTCPGSVRDYDEAFFGGDGIAASARLARRTTARAAPRVPATRASARRSRARARSSASV